MMPISRFLAVLSCVTSFAFASDTLAINEELPPWLLESDEEPELSQQQIEAVEEAAQLLLKVYYIVQGINDRASADAAAPELQKLAEHAEELEKKNVPSLLAIAKFEEYGGSRIQTEICGNRLVNNGFYGSHALAEVVGAPESAVFELATPTPEFMEKLGAEIKAAMVAMFPAVTGGPGFDEETAWRLPAQSEFEEAMFTAVLPDDYEPEDAEFVQGDDDTRLWMIRYCLKRGDKKYPLHLWIDVTEAVEIESAESDE